MALVDQKSDLTSLKFGVAPASDRPAGGNSNQPYVKEPIIDGNILPQSEDFLLRGGLNAITDTATDLIRIGKMFADLKSPNGLLFIAKQNILSRISVASQASGNQSDKNKWKSAALNESVYTPLNTLAQVGVNFSGLHFNKQGALPNSLRTYSDVVKGNGVEDEDTSIVGVKNNRLIQFHDNYLILKDGATIGLDGKPVNPVNLYSYAGGPNSVVGIGSTDIKFATTAKGAPLLSTNFYRDNVIDYDGTKPIEYLNNTAGLQLDRFNLVRPPLGTTLKYAQLNGGEVVYGVNEDEEGNFISDDLTNIEVYTGKQDEEGTSNLVWLNSQGGLMFNNIISNTPYLPGGFEPNNSTNSPAKIYGIGKKKNFTTLTYPQTMQIGTVLKQNPNTITNFQSTILQEVKELPENDPNRSSTIMSISPSYNPSSNKSIEGKGTSRINMSSPGIEGNILSYTTGKVVNDILGQAKVNIVDRVNYLPIYKSTENKTSEQDGINDLIKFRISAVLRDGQKVYMHFRAFLNEFSDTYESSWDSLKYMGRGESFYKYNGFGRSVSLSFTVAAQSRPELMAQYKKLNFLASTLAPDYGGKKGSGYMGGVLTTLTVGGWCYELPGFIGSLGLTIPEESPWEIGIDDTVSNGKGSSSPSVKEMPHICNVSLSYTPIHRFRPELQDNTYGGDGEITKYGKQHYLGLTNGDNNNYTPVSLAQAEEIGSSQSTTENNI